MSWLIRDAVASVKVNYYRKFIRVLDRAFAAFLARKLRRRNLPLNSEVIYLFTNYFDVA